MARKRRRDRVNKNRFEHLGKIPQMPLGGEIPSAPSPDQQVMVTIIRQLVTEQVMMFMNQFIGHLNEVSENTHLAISMIEGMRQLMTSKGLITDDEFTETVENMRERTKRANDIANDFDTPEEDRVKMMVDECELDEATAQNLVEHAKSVREGLVMAEEGDNNGQGSAPPEPE